jgi:hypothetical protein
MIETSRPEETSWKAELSTKPERKVRREMAKFAVLTYSENGAIFPNDGMGSPFCKPNEKFRTRVAKNVT